MKKILSVILTLCMVMTCLPMTVWASTTTETPDLSDHGELASSAVSDTLYAPVIVSGDTATQGGKTVDTITNGDTLLVDVSAVAETEETTDDVYTIETEQGEIVLTADSEDAVVKVKEEENTVALGAEVVVSEETLYAPLDSLAQLCDMEIVEEGDKTVYVKPFQTKRLIVDGDQIPDVGEIAEETIGSETVLTFETEAECKEAYETLRHNRKIKSVTGENVYSVCELSESDFARGENLSWGADYIDSPQFVDYVQENRISASVTVAIVDTGINTAHSFLKDRISDASKSYVSSEPTVEDKNGHGSHVAGIIADNTPSNVKLLAVKGLDKDGYGSSSDLANAIRYAADAGADIINMSFGGYDFWTSTAEKAAVKYAYDKGAIPVAAAGNESDNANSYYPASSQYCITVAASDSDGGIGYFSNYGTCVDVAAPGVNIFSCVAKGNQTDLYDTYSGTSMATPFVCAACADLQTMKGKQSFEKAKSYITTHVTPYTKKTQNYGTGIISLTDYIGVKRTSPVLFQTQSGYYQDTMTVALSNSDTNAKIYYTTDGSNPSDQNGTLYTTPLTVDDSVNIKAIAYSQGLYKSKITRAYYLFNDTDIDANFIVDDRGYITSYKGSMTSLSVNKIISGKTVKGIGESAFEGNTTVNSIVLPDTVTEIENNAFHKCTKLTSVIAENVTKIGNDAFKGASLETVSFGRLTSLGSGAFSGNSKINQDMIDISALTEIASYAFYNCGFTLLNLDRITKVGNYAFYRNNLIDIKLDNAVSLGDYAFANTRIENAKIKNVETLGNDCFHNCDQLTHIEAEHLKSIGSWAFGSCRKLETIDTSQVTKTGANSFSGCAVKSLDLRQLESLPNNAFCDAHQLETVLLPEQETVPVQCFDFCYALKEIPQALKNAKKIGRYAYRDTAISVADFPKATYIGDEALSGCNHLETINAPLAEYFGNMHYYNNNSLKTLTAPEVREFGSLDGAALLEEVSLPKAVSLGYAAFRGCRSLKEVYAPLVTVVTANCFSDCLSLERITLSDVTNIADSAFMNCQSLKAGYFPRCVSVSQSAFKNCTSLEILDLRNVKNINAQYDIAENCPNLKHLLLDNLEKCNVCMFATNTSLKEVLLPKLEVYSAYVTYYFMNTTMENADVNLHMPRLKELRVDDEGLLLKGLALPMTIKTVARYTTTTKPNKTPVVFYTNAENAEYSPYVNYETYPSPVLIDDLDSEFTLTSSSSGLTVRVYCADPIYQWYYSADGETFTEVENAARNTCVPAQSGYYYCTVTENGSNSEVTSSVCKVNAESGAVKLTSNIEEEINVLCNDVLYQHIVKGESIMLPKGADVTVLYNGTFEEINAGGQTIKKSDAGFDLRLSSDTVLNAESKYLLKNATINLNLTDETRRYTGRPIVPNETLTIDGVTLKEGIDYTKELYNNVEANQNSFVVFTGKGKYSGTVKSAFVILRRNIGTCDINVSDMTYTGREVKPHISISYQGCELTDYTVEYNNNVAPGKANVVVYGNNNLMGNKRVYFQIRRSLDGATVTLDKTQYTYSAAEIRPNVTVVLDGTTLQQGTDYTVSYADNTNVGTAKVTVSGAGNYTGTLTASFKILPAPVVKNGWQKEGGKWYYYNNNVKQTGWKKIGGKWYLFAYAGGQMLTGWVKSGGKWYYFNSSGAMVTGWQKISGVWYYFNASGAMVTGWQKISGKWYYFNSSGSMRTANLKQGNKTYRFASSGACLNP